MPVKQLLAYLLLSLALLPLASAKEALSLTPEERSWLEAHPEIRLGIDPDWPPFEYLSEQQHYSGIAADYIALLSDKLGVEMEPVAGLSWSGVLEAAQQKRLDLLPAAMATPQRQQYLRFTAPYLDFPMVVVTRDDAPFVSSLEALAEQRVAVVKDYVSHEVLQQNHPYLQLAPYPTIGEALTALSTGEIDAFVGNLASISHAIRQLGLGNLKVAAHTPYSFALGMGVRDDWPELVAILDKALQGVTPEEVRRIQQKWIGLQLEEGVDLVAVALVVGPLLGAALTILLVVTWINRRLRREITVRREVERQLRLSEEALTESQRTAHIGWWRWDLAHNTLLWSDEVYTITGKRRDEFTPTPDNFISVVHPEDAQMLGDAIQGVMEGREEQYDLEFRVQLDDGTVRHVHSYGRLYGSAVDESNYFAGVLHDISERKEAEQQLRLQAFYDTLTGLPNRNFFMEQLRRTLALSRRHHYYSALLFFDLDNFKIINDTLGHHTGDKLLAEVGRRLGGVTRQEDTAARLGGDEFVVIATNLGDDIENAAQEARLIAEKLHNSLCQPINIDDHDHHLTLSTGINLFPMAEEDTNDILKFADTAMYRAKESGRDAIRFFQPSMQEAAEERFALHGKLRQALQQQEFELYYQPQYNSKEQIIGAESLLRWQQPELGQVSPARFIPLAEESGMILEIGNWVLRQACWQLSEWERQGLDVGTLAVNVSPRQFHQPEFVSQVEEIVADSGIDPNHLELELTEGILVENIEEVTQKIEQLQQMGICFAIDDFGTGYSSLRYLKQLPLDRLKIDQSFVRDIQHNETNAHIVETIISMGQNLELELIAEGVETDAEMEFLRVRSCHKFQGYFFSKPLPAEQMTELLRASQQQQGENGE